MPRARHSLIRMRSSKHLERANLFVIPLDSERRWYRYHRLFADFLRTELSRGEELAQHQPRSRLVCGKRLRARRDAARPGGRRNGRRPRSLIGGGGSRRPALGRDDDPGDLAGGAARENVLRRTKSCSPTGRWPRCWPAAWPRPRPWATRLAAAGAAAGAPRDAPQTGRSRLAGVGAGPARRHAAGARGGRPDCGRRSLLQDPGVDHPGLRAKRGRRYGRLGRQLPASLRAEPGRGPAVRRDRCAGEPLFQPAGRRPLQRGGRAGARRRWPATWTGAAGRCRCWACSTCRWRCWPMPAMTWRRPKPMPARALALCRRSLLAQHLGRRRRDDAGAGTLRARRAQRAYAMLAEARREAERRGSRWWPNGWRCKRPCCACAPATRPRRNATWPPRAAAHWPAARPTPSAGSFCRPGCCWRADDVPSCAQRPGPARSASRPAAVAAARLIANPRAAGGGGAAGGRRAGRAGEHLRGGAAPRRPEGYRRAFLDAGPAVAELLPLARAAAPEFVDDLLARFAATPAGPTRGAPAHAAGPARPSHARPAAWSNRSASASWKSCA